jgi:hypothetical protein
MVCMDCMAEVCVWLRWSHRNTISYKLSYTLVYIEHIHSTTESLLVVAIHLNGNRAVTSRLLPFSPLPASFRVRFILIRERMLQL